MTSPTQRSLAHLKASGYCAQVVERFNPYAKVRIDLFGFIDIVAIRSSNIREGIDEQILAVQTTSRDNMNARVQKILLIPEAKIWLKAGGLIVVHGWALGGAVGKRKLWTLKEKNITLQDFP